MTTPLYHLAVFVLLPALLGLLIDGARDAMRRDRRAWLTGERWLASFDEDTATQEDTP